MRRLLSIATETITALIVSSAVMASPYHDRTLKSLELKRAEPYSRARSMLARHGWTPFRTKQDHGTAGDVMGAGWHEVFFCSGTGRAFCTFIWKQGARCALITTAGEYYPEDGAPKVWDAEVDTCPKILKRA
jgi:hypothetical protein